ncbi:hypothetical protein M3Y99_01844000 [Aphelenchoides fujianensis]|nr:hypothetical protein M3Y99_01844000 [Aphelenchoides fujianensis]
MPRRPEPIKDAVVYDEVLRKKKQMLTPEPDDATAARYLELKPRVQALYAWDAHAGLCDTIAAALRAPERQAASAEAAIPFARHLVDHRAWESSLATLGDYAEFDRANAAFRPAADVQPALVWVDTKRGENLLAALFLRDRRRPHGRGAARRDVPLAGQRPRRSATRSARAWSRSPSAATPPSASPSSWPASWMAARRSTSRSSSPTAAPSRRGPKRSLR